jgi:hypothetical protein
MSARVSRKDLMFYILCAFATFVSLFLVTSAFILFGAIPGVCAAMVMGIADVWWLGEVYEVWCEYD